MPDGQDGFGRDRSTVKCAVKPTLCRPPPAFDAHSGLDRRVEDLSVEQFIAKFSSEGY